MGMREHRLSYSETVRKYELGNEQTGGTRAMLQRWECIFLEEGIIFIFTLLIQMVILKKNID